MSFSQLIARIASAFARHRHQETEPRYDNVQVVNMVDASTIKGHNAVKAHFQQEMKLLELHGASIIFQVYRANLSADTIKKLQGPKLAEIKVKGEFVSGDDTVATVKEKVCTLLASKAWQEHYEQEPDGIQIEPADHITLFFSGRPMQDETAFYADNFILLPTWIQVLIHRCTPEDVVQLIEKLEDKSQPQAS